MVLIQPHPHAQAAALHQAIARIQPSRIFGIAGAITLNAAALMLLLVPVSAPMPNQMLDEEKKPILWIEPEPKIIREKPIEVPLENPTRTKPEKTTNPPTTPQQTVTQEETVAPEGNEYFEPTHTEPTPDIGPTLPTNPGPLPSTRLEYASAPAPTYPREAMLDGIEGTVLLKVLVDVDGKPLSVEIERSSGNRRLDDAARRQVLRKWMFRPAIRDGQAIQVFGMVPVSFSLQ